MNVVGIDYGQTASLVVLREGDAPIRSVGDGLRTIIPHAATAGDDGKVACWGSHALLPSVCAPTLPARPVAESPSQRRNDAFLIGETVPFPPPAPKPSLLRSGPWVDEPDATLFWSGLHDRLYRYLGQMAPTLANGYRVVIAISPGDSATSVRQVRQLARQAGLHDVDVVRTTDALMSQFLASLAAKAIADQEQPPPPLVAVAVALGDVTTDVAGYRLSPHALPNGTTVLRAESNVPVPASLPQGQAHWAARLQDLLCRQLREPLTPAQEFLLHDGAREYGAALGRAEQDDTVVAWSGPFRDRMYAPLRLCVLDCLSDWPEARALTDTLPDAVRTAAHSAGATNGIPDVVVLGGVGASWPFARRALQQAFPADTPESLLIWSGETASEGIARGATWWPRVGAATLTALDGEIAPPATPPAPTVAAKPRQTAPKKETRPRDTSPPSAPRDQPSSEDKQASANDAAMLPPSLRRLEF